MKNAFVKLVIIAAPIVIIGGLALRDADSDGSRVVRYVVGESSPYVNSMLPSDRVGEVRETENGAAQAVTSEPTYFSVEPPGEGYEQVRVELAFDPNEQPIVELGALADLRSYAFDFRPMSNAILETLDWPQLTLASDGVQTKLFSREPVKATIEDFLANPPERSAIATYRATFPTPYRKANYTPLGGMRHLTTSLRGSHTILTYVKNEDVNVTLSYADVNRTFGADDVSVSIWSEDGTLMTQESIADDNNTSEDQVPLTGTLTLRGSDWSEGVYRIELSGTSDIMWRTIDTSLRYVTFKNTLYLGDDVGYRDGDIPHDFVSNADRLTVETFHAESPDEITLNSLAFVIPETHVRQVIDAPKLNFITGHVDAGDIKMTADGKFALAADMFFDPDPVPLTPFTDYDNVSYIYATVAAPTTERGWRTADTTFDLAPLALENGAYKFAISAPGLDELGTTIDIHAIEFTFTKPPISLAQAIYNEARLFWHALKDLL